MSFISINFVFNKFVATKILPDFFKSSITLGQKSKPFILEVSIFLVSAFFSTLLLIVIFLLDESSCFLSILEKSIFPISLIFSSNIFILLFISSSPALLVILFSLEQSFIISTCNIKLF